MSTHPDPWWWRELVAREIRLVPPVLEVPVRAAAGRLLGAAVRSPEDAPALAVSAMDGFAVRREDLVADAPTRLPVAMDVPARAGAVPALAAGTAARIMTGAPLPVGADLVVEVEATDAEPRGPVPAEVVLAPGALPTRRRHVRDRGEEVARGDLLAQAGDRVGAGLVGLACTLGLETLPVLGAPRVGIVATGDELVGSAAGRAGGDGVPGAVRESNGRMLAAALEAEGCAVEVLRSGDDPAQLEEVLDEAAADADLVLTTGGIGHGAYDVVKELLGPHGRDSSRFAHLALRPGGPQGLGVLGGGAPGGRVPVVHLPGTPVGALVGLHLFVRPLLPGADAAPRRMLLEDPRGRIERSRSRDGLVVEPARTALGPDGSVRAALLDGRRLAPYGRADLLVLGGRAAGTEQPGTALVVPL
ncbi:molybdopterin molybdotransferase MoeA [Brachybacterium sp. AOP43-C2-M15]|uniref:molybdopterin molybdotransferase MoeA n=1 Tax=Brachybacterium sp. AOP43-C2-M15 TaxID=3457661 RepID=UPI0040334BB5